MKIKNGEKRMHCALFLTKTLTSKIRAMYCVHCDSWPLNRNQPVIATKKHFSAVLEIWRQIYLARLMLNRCRGSMQCRSVQPNANRMRWSNNDPALSSSNSKYDFHFQMSLPLVALFHTITHCVSLTKKPMHSNRRTIEMRSNHMRALHRTHCPYGSVLIIFGTFQRCIYISVDKVHSTSVDVTCDMYHTARVWPSSIQSFAAINWINFFCSEFQ